MGTNVLAGRSAARTNTRTNVEHNFAIMMQTNWAETFRQQFEQDFVRIAVD